MLYVYKTLLDYTYFNLLKCIKFFLITSLRKILKDYKHYLLIM